jgi:hypothetical protein
MTTTDSQPEYRSYLLRVWSDDARGIWHASLQSTLTKAVRHFATVEALMGFLASPPPVEAPDARLMSAAAGDLPSRAAPIEDSAPDRGGLQT